MTTTFRPIYLFSFALSFVIPTLFLRYAGEWVLGCMAPAWSQWMGSVFFTTIMILLLWGSQKIQQQLTLLPDPRLPATDKTIIQRTTFACSASVLGFLILYIFVLMVVILMAYNAPLIAWPYAWIWTLLSIVVVGAGIHLLMISNNVANRLEEVEEEERKKEEEREKERRNKVYEEESASWKDDQFISSLSYEERIMILRKRFDKKKMEEVD